MENKKNESRCFHCNHTKGQCTCLCCCSIKDMGCASCILPLVCYKAILALLDKIRVKT